jgi:MFS family permease
MLVLSSFAYPGGSWADKSAEGFEPLVNYWCDLMRTEAVNGLPNATSAALAKSAFGALAASLSVYWWVAASLLTSARLARWGIASGVLASVSVVLMLVLPYDTQPRLHAVTTLSAGGFGFLATLFIMVGSLRSGAIARWRHAWGAALLVAAIANIVVYADIVLRDNRDSATLPVIQKFGTLFFALWMTATVLATRSDRRKSPD